MAPQQNIRLKVAAFNSAARPHVGMIARTFAPGQTLIRAFPAPIDSAIGTSIRRSVVGVCFLRTGRCGRFSCFGIQSYTSVFPDPTALIRPGQFDLLRVRFPSELRFDKRAVLVDG
jgi:hypothetical protein